tara:strand:+ start:7780 stop:8985 length:1206 start_codon:yes stop_codon:yes gene_type:complete
MSKILYISYDGILEPLGYSQVWSYLKELSKNNEIWLLSFEKKKDILDQERIINMKQDCLDCGIKWKSLDYHKSPTALATGFDIFLGCLVAFMISYRNKISIIHVRSYVPALIGVFVKKLLGTKFIFDMRGLWPDEKVDSGSWKKKGMLYKIAKFLEKSFFLNADIIVSLTRAGVKEIKSFPYLQSINKEFKVITTCANLKVFNLPQEKGIEESSLNKPFTLGHVGSVTLWYAFEEALVCYQMLQKIDPSARFFILNKGQHDLIQKKLDDLDIDQKNVTLIEASQDEVANFMQQMDAGIFFIKPFYSKISSAPTKLGEFLGSGVPCLGNHGIGDMTDILEANNVGVSIKDFNRESLQKGLQEIMQLSKEPDIKRRCRKVAEENFSLERGVQSYQQIYNHLDR